MSLLAQARKNTKYFLIIDSFLVVMGFSVVFPLISVNFIDKLHWAALSVGFALGMRQLVQQGLGLLTGALADKFGARKQIITGMLLRAAGFVLMSIAYAPWVLVLACVVSALGGALFDPPRNALAIKMTRPHERARFFSLIMMIDGAGAVLGALLGSWLLAYDFRWVSLVGCIVFIAAALWNYWVLPDYKVSSNTGLSMWQSMRSVLKDKRFVYFVLSLSGYYIIGVQVMLMIPILVAQVAGTPTAVKWMYTIEAILAITLLYPIARWSEKHFNLYQRMMFGFMITIVMLIPMGFISNLSLLLGIIAVFYLGSIIADPAREALIATLVHPKARASYSGFSRLGLAVGGFIGYTGGGWLYDLGQTLKLSFLPWWLLAGCGLLTAYSFYRQFGQRPK